MRIQAIFKRILLQRFSDKRSLVLLFVAPLLILGLLYLLLQVPSNLQYRIGLDDSARTKTQQTTNTQLVQQLKKNHKLKLIKVTNNSRSTMNHESLDAIILLKASHIDITYANSDTSKTQAISAITTTLIQVTQGKKLQQEIEQTINEGLKKNSAVNSQPSTERSKLSEVKVQSMTVTNHYLYGTSKLSLFDNLAPVLVSFFVFFFVFLISGISLVNERTSGTLQRMLVTPVKRNEIVAGYTLAYGLLAVIQTGLVVLWARYVLAMQVLGNFAWVLLINLLIALIALLIGLLLSALAKTEFQFIQFVPLAIVPQFLFSGIITVDTMSKPLQILAHIMPLYYGVDALKKVIKQNLGFNQIRFDLGILFAIVILLYFLNVIALKSLRRT